MAAKPRARRQRVSEVQAAIVTPIEPPQAVVVGDLEAMFRAQYGRLVRALTVVAGSRDMAADAVQEAFVAAHLHWRKIRRYDDPVGWIRRVAINKLRDEGRRTTRQRRTLDRLEAQPAQTADGPAPGADLGAMLAGLPRQQRIALALYYIEDLAVTAIAAAMGITEGAVKFHLHQGRQRLRAAVQEDAP